MPVIWNVALSVYAFTALLRTLAAACDGAVGVACVNSQIVCNGRGVLVSVLFAAGRKVDEIGLLENTFGSSLDTVASLIAYSTSSEEDWASGKRIQLLSPYQFSSWQINDVSERRMM